MIICNSKKFVFVHIPKCGGTSIGTVLESQLLPQDITLNLNPNNGWKEYIKAYHNKFGLYKHSTAAEVAKAMKPSYLRRYYVFTFCRNPFASAYSAYKLTLRADAKHRPSSERYKEIKDMSFEQFLQSRYVQDHMLLATKLQSSWISNSPVSVNIFKLEEAQESLGILFDKFYPLSAKRAKLPRANSSTVANEWVNMSSLAEDIIRSCYDEDFHAFGYLNYIERQMV